MASWELFSLMANGDGVQIPWSAFVALFVAIGAGFTWMARLLLRMHREVMSLTREVVEATTVSTAASRDVVEGQEHVLELQREIQGVVTRCCAGKFPPSGPKSDS